MSQTVSLHHRIVGEGPALIVLHGLLGSGTNWRSIARSLADCRQVHLLDLRNHGDSPHDAQMDYPSMASDVTAYLDRQGIARADLIGHSMGGKTAMRLAMDDPGRVSRLLVVDIAPAPSSSDHEPLLDAMAAMPVSSYARRAQADEALARTVPEAPLRAFLLQNLESDDGALRWRINLAAIRAAMPALLASPVRAGEVFRGETLFLRGATSDYVRDEHLPDIRSHFPAGRLETLPGAGHWLHAEQPAAFLETARRFLGCAGAR
jgi:esterase